jgi:glycosyltransferase involved in cell wall biosynthesis
MADRENFGPSQAMPSALPTGSRLNDYGSSGTDSNCPAVETCRILALATQGAGGNDEARLRDLLTCFSVDFYPFERAKKIRSFWGLLAAIRRRHPPLVVIEGTGLAGGLAVLLGRLLAGVSYIVSSGDAVGPFVGSQHPWLGPIFQLYERLLYRCSAGFIGWTPYLTGRALTFGAPRAVTAPGWAPHPRSAEQRAAGRATVRRKLAIPPGALVIGLVGSLAWNRRIGYCYGYELVRAVLGCKRADVHALIVGDGNGRAGLEKLAGTRLGKTIHLTGPVSRDQVPDYLAAMDIASLPQSLDGVGSFRYTTKLSEYLAAELPVITGQIPLAYDLDRGWLWRLPGKGPWTDRYIKELSAFLNRIGCDDIKIRSAAAKFSMHQFDRDQQIDRVTAFLNDTLKESLAKGHQSWAGRPMTDDP